MPNDVNSVSVSAGDTLAMLWTRVPDSSLSGNMVRLQNVYDGSQQIVVDAAFAAKVAVGEKLPVVAGPGLGIPAQ